MSFDIIIDQHKEGSATSWLARDAAVSEPHISLRDLSEQDGILESHMEGLQLSGTTGWNLVVEELQWNGPGDVFVASVLAFSSRDKRKVQYVAEKVVEFVELRRPIVSALGWLSWAEIEAHAIRSAESNNDPSWRYVGIAAFEIHRRDPGNRLSGWLDDDDVAIQARAIQAVGTLARLDLLERVADHVSSEDPLVSVHACWTLAFRRRDAVAIARLQEFVQDDGSNTDAAGRLLMSALPVEESRDLINHLVQGNERQLRLATILTGLLGIPDSVPWLIEMMKQPEYARVAGESFSRITGLRLDQRPFEGEWPDGFEAGPNDDPEDENVEMDEDENLPWPEPEVVSRWWHEHSCHFESNVRYLLGWEVSNEAWLRKILVLGRQRERATAALELALLNPHEPLFEIRANGNRQMKQLGQKRLPTEEYRCNKLEAGPDGDEGQRL